MARKKVVFVIVEGPSDDAALGVILNRLFDKSKVHIEIIHGDITTDLNIDPVDIASALGKIVKDYAESMHFSQVHFQQVIHLVDMDGAFIPDTSIVENPDADNPIYSLTEIQTARPEQMAKRNEHKQRVLNRISKLKKVWASIPYQVYYMSCNLDHVLHGKLNKKKMMPILLQRSTKTILMAFLHSYLIQTFHGWRGILIPGHSSRKNITL